MLIALVLSLAFGQVSAAVKPVIKPQTAVDTTSVSRFAASLAALRARLDTVVVTPQEQYEGQDADGRYFRLFVPATFYHDIAKRAFSLDQQADTESLPAAIDEALLSLYLTRGDLIRNSDKSMMRLSSVPKGIGKQPQKQVVYQEKVKQPLEEDVSLPLDLVVRKPNFWSFGGDYYLQFLQNFVSSNWYKGGESNYSMVSSATFIANYNNKQKVKWDNKLELKLGFQTSKSDSVHSLKTSEDLIRYTGKLGLEATKRWYYTLQLLAYTQFVNGYKSNKREPYSAFLSPLNVNLSVGMDYNVKAFHERLSGTLHIAPLAYNFRYVGKRELAKSYGLKADRHTLDDFGSTLTADLTWKFSDMLRWKTRLYGYTTYERAEVEWENTLTFQFNRYISSNLFIYPRFDDGTRERKDKDHGYFQFKEYASLGFSYNF